MPFDLKMRDAMVSQDCLYTLVLKDPQGQWTPKVIGSIIKYLYAPDNPRGRHRADGRPGDAQSSPSP